MRRLLLVPLTVMLVAAQMGVASASGGASVHCGQTLTADTRLTSDLLNCPGSGLVIGADNVTVDLAGHVIDGVNSPGSEGVAVDGHSGVRITNGTIREFFLNGVGLRNAPGSSVTNLRIAAIGAGGGDGQASAGVLVKDSAGTVVKGNTVTNDVEAFQSDGIDVLFSPNTRLINNRVLRNAWNGAFVLASPGSTIVGNHFDANKNQGIEVNFGSDAAEIRNNHARGNVADGIVVGAVSGVRVVDNETHGNADTGIFFFDLIDSMVSGNDASGNSAGIVLAGGQNGSHGNRLVGNNTSRNTEIGLVLDTQADDNTVIGNVSNKNLGAPGEGGGIIVFDSTGNALVGNVANGNLDVGLGVFESAPGNSAGNSLRRNVANHNAGHGIDAVPGTIDLGGNVAHGNTPAPDCVGVLCA